MDRLVDAVNATGVWLQDLLAPVPVDLLMCGFTTLALWVWYENFKAWLHRKRLARKRALGSLQKLD